MTGAVRPSRPDPGDFQPPTLEALPEAVARNVAIARARTRALIMAVVKADGYGHEAGMVAQAAVVAGALAVVALWYEATRFDGEWPTTGGDTAIGLAVTAAAGIVALAVAVVVGYAALEGVPNENPAWPPGFAAGAVLAPLPAPLMPEAFREGGPPVAYATALGFLLSFMVSSTAHPLS